MQFHIRDRPCGTVPQGTQIVSYSEMCPQASYPHQEGVSCALPTLKGSNQLCHQQ